MANQHDPLYAEDLLPDRFINSPTTIACNVLSGVINSNANVGMLNDGKVIVRRDYAQEDIVKVLSGGPTGHEPAHAGFVGKGMLTAAVQGDLYRTPKRAKIVNAIKEISYQMASGVLVIIQNNTSDRLMFGLAVERARNQAIDARLLLVTDEFYPVNRLHGKKGLSGIVLVYKIAGELAERGLFLEEIYNNCKLVNENMSTILFNLKPLPAITTETCICSKAMEPFLMEIGTGLHGEQGLLRTAKSTAKYTCAYVLDAFIEHFEIKKEEPIVIMVNNLGSALKLEELIVVNEVVNYMHSLQISIARLYSGKFVTSLNMEGFSITVLRVFNDLILECLDAQCEAVGWGGFVSKSPITASLQDPIISRVSKRKRITPGGPRLTSEEGNVVFHVTQFACDALISCTKQLNIMDSDDGAGDVGYKMKRGAQNVLSQMQKNAIDFTLPREVFAILSEISESHICGGIGALYAIFFEAASNAFRKLEEHCCVCVGTWLEVLQSANAAIKQYGNVDCGVGTLYDPLHAGSEMLAELLHNGVEPLEAYRISVNAAEDAVLKTRSELKRHPDAGAHTVGVWMRAVYEGLKLRFE